MAALLCALDAAEMSPVTEVCVCMCRHLEFECNDSPLLCMCQASEFEEFPMLGREEGEVLDGDVPGPEAATSAVCASFFVFLCLAHVDM